MPLVFELNCAICGFHQELTTGYFVVDLDDGREAVCRHPAERLEARRLTGLEWEELARAGRIGYRHALTCQACGRTGYYRSPNAFRVSRIGLLGGISHIPSQEDADLHACQSCSRRAMVPSGRVGRGLGYMLIACPDCGELLERTFTGRAL
jgi:hypothetical protein